MDHITVRHIVEAVSGTLLCGDADTELKHISIDSRSMRGADLFVPLIRRASFPGSGDGQWGGSRTDFGA